MVVTLREGLALPQAATFLVEIGDDSLEPEFRRGAALYVDARQPAEIGDAVLLVSDAALLVAVLLGRSPAGLQIRTAGRVVELSAAVAELYRIVPLAELLL